MANNRDKIQAAIERLENEKSEIEKQISNLEDAVEQINSNIESLNELENDADECYIDELKKW